MEGKPINEFEILCDEVMINPSSIGAQQLSQYFDRSSNFLDIYSILFNSRHPYLLFLSINSLTNQLPNNWKTLTSEQKLHIYSTISSLFLQNEAKPGYLSAATCKLLTRICRLGWIELENCGKTAESLIDFVKVNPAFMKFCLKFFEEMIIEINEPIRHRSNIVNRRIAVRFRDQSLGLILSFCVNELVSLKTPEFHKEILTIIGTALNFDLLLGNQDESNEEPSIFHVPLTWKKILCRGELIDALEKMVVHCSDEVGMMALRTLSYLGVIRKTVFEAAEERKEYIKRLLAAFMAVIKSKRLDKEGLNEVIKALKKLFTNFVLKDIVEIVDFKEILSNLLQFTEEILSIPNFTLDSESNSLVLWSYFSYEGFSQAEDSKLFVPLAFQLFLTKIREFITLDFIVSNPDGQLKCLIDLLGIFSINYYPQVVSAMETLMKFDLESLSGGLIHEPQLAFLIFTYSSFLSTSNKNSGPDLDESIVQSITPLLPKLSTLGYSIELAIISFCSSFSSVYLNSSIDNFWGDNSLIIGSIPLGQIAYSILELILSNLNKYEKGKVLEESLSLFDRLCSGYYSTKIISALPSAFSLINYPICRFTDRKLRTRLFHSLIQLWTTEENDLMRFYECVIHRVRSGAELSLVFAELQGICEAMNNQKMYSEFFENIAEDIWKVISECTNWTDFEAFRSMIRFFQEYTENRNKRIEFDSVSAAGIILFKRVTQVLIVYANSVVDDEKIISKTSRVLKIVNNFIIGNYVCFEVFEIYNDDPYLKALSLCFHLINRCKEPNTYPKLMERLYDFIEGVFKHSLKVLMVQMHPNCFTSSLSYLNYAVTSESIGHLDLSYMIECSNSLYSFCIFLQKCSRMRNNVDAEILKALQRESELIERIYFNVFDAILSNDGNIMWTFNKVLLGLAVTNESMYEKAKESAIERFSQSDDVRVRLREAFNSLFEDVNKSLEPANKEIFIKNFSKFKQTLISFQ